METEPKPQLKEYGNWIKGDLKKEGGELERTLITFFGEEFSYQNKKEVYEEILELYQSAELESLNDKMWSDLENTESWSVPMGDFNEVSRIVGDKRDWASLRDSFQENNEMEAPIIAHLPNGKYHLISGNTRLCVAKASGIRSKVFILELPDFK